MTEALVQRRYTVRRLMEDTLTEGIRSGTEGPVFLVIRMVSGTEYRVPYGSSALAEMAMSDIATRLDETIRRAGNGAAYLSSIHPLSLEGGRRVRIAVLNVESMEIVPADPPNAREADP